MNHTAGFEEGLKDLLAYDPKLAPSNEDYLKQHPRPMLFAPGQAPGYSNYGVALAGYIVQRVSGEPFDAYVDRHIFQPLGMRHSTTAQPLPAKFEPFIAKGYRQASDPAPSPFESVVTAPAGSGSATAADVRASCSRTCSRGRLDSVELLSPATTALMHSPSAQAPARLQRDGARLFPGVPQRPHAARPRRRHHRVPFRPEPAADEGVGIFVSFNSRGKDSAVYLARKALMEGFLDRYFPGQPVVGTPALASAPKDAQLIAGRYQTSRRVEHGFLSALYLMNQTVIAANPDGTIVAPSGPTGGWPRFREAAPQLWRKQGGTQEGSRWPTSTA